MHKGNAPGTGILFEHLLLGYGVQTAYHSVAAVQELWQVFRIGGHYPRVYFHVRGNAKQAVPAGKSLGLAQGLFCAKVLAVEIALLETFGSHRRRAPMPRRTKRTAT